MFCWFVQPTTSLVKKKKKNLNKQIEILEQIFVFISLQMNLIQSLIPELLDQVVTGGLGLTSAPLAQQGHTGLALSPFTRAPRDSCRSFTLPPESQFRNP